MQVFVGQDDTKPVTACFFTRHMLRKKGRAFQNIGINVFPFCEIILAFLILFARRYMYYNLFILLVPKSLPLVECGVHGIVGIVSYLPLRVNLHNKKRRLFRRLPPISRTYISFLFFKHVLKKTTP